MRRRSLPEITLPPDADEDQTTLETLLRLAIVPGMGPARTTVLLRRFGSVERVLGTTAT